MVKVRYGRIRACGHLSEWRQAWHGELIRKDVRQGCPSIVPESPAKKNNKTGKME
jgi:hypothetical protein